MILRFGLWVRMVLLKTCGYLLTPLREFRNLCMFSDRSSQGRLTGNGVVQLLWRVLDYRCEISDQTGCLSSSRCNWRQWAPCQRPRCCSGASWGCTMCSHWCCVCPPVTTSTGPRMKNRPSTTAPSQQVGQMTDHRTVTRVNTSWDSSRVWSSSAGFSWGAGSSAYQTEGAWNIDGKGMSIWDAFARKKGKIFSNDTGDSSCEGYYKYKVTSNENSAPLWKKEAEKVLKWSLMWCLYVCVCHSFKLCFRSGQCFLFSTFQRFIEAEWKIHVYVLNGDTFHQIETLKMSCASF